jgi:hypothetical protein
MAEYDLRVGGSSTGRVLMRRSDADAAWSDIATFTSYNDADWVLRQLRKAEATDAAMDAVLDALQDVIAEWDARGDGGCTKEVQDALREAVIAL